MLRHTRGQAATEDRGTRSGREGPRRKALSVQWGQAGRGGSEQAGVAEWERGQGRCPWDRVRPRDGGA